MAKKKGLAEKIDQEEEELLENKEMFMSVKDFQERMVVLPTEFGRKKKGAGKEPEEEPPVEEELDDEEGEEEVEEGEEEEEDDGEEEGEDGEEGESSHCNRECYQFNPKLSMDQDDRCCKHCRLFLTLQCPHISEFMDDVEDGDVD